ncbi:MAG: hypothetical protein OJF49_002458 [Ktedonobacterales bacterium]|jgi:uncharacterized protein YjbI with pentapeptide repeats|nr:MAG: hypothetical protein OJF49_002458 [Ktedonobacterales bacterium]
MTNDDSPDYVSEENNKHVARQRVTFLDPPAERQAELERAYNDNIGAGQAPYQGVRIATRDELLWIVRQRNWATEYDSFYYKYILNPRGVYLERANFTGANLAGVDLSQIVLRRANLTRANLIKADLTGADLVDARLDEADIGYAILKGAHLGWSHLNGTHLRRANLNSARMMFSNLSGAGLFATDLRGANLYAARMDSFTSLGQVQLDSATRLGDIIWNGAPLTYVNWDTLKRLGDEAELSIRTTADGVKKSKSERIANYESALRAYNQVALALQTQGMSDIAARFAYRGRTLERRLLWRKRKLGRWLFLALLGLLAGYGYRMSRILVAYAVVVLLSAAAYYLLGQQHTPHLQVHEALLVSVTAFHGRVFAEQFHVDSPQAWITAIEAVAGLVIEGVFIAMLAQRFFGK